MILTQKNTNRQRIDGGNGLARQCFIFAGQSNVDAYQFIVDLPAPQQQIFTGVNFFQYNADMRTKFVPLNYGSNPDYQAPNQTARYALQFFLYPTLKTLLGIDNIYIVHHAQGGTALASDWKSTATIGLFYINLVYKSLAAKNLFTDVDGIAPNFRFFFWGQGEADSANSTLANAHEANLTNFINNFRAAIGVNVPFLIGRINSNIDAGTFPNWSTVRTAQTNVAATLSNVFIVNQDDAEMAVDNVHYTNAGYQTITNNIISVAQINGLLP